MNANKNKMQSLKKGGEITKEENATKPGFCSGNNYFAMIK